MIRDDFIQQALTAIEDACRCRKCGGLRHVRADQVVLGEGDCRCSAERENRAKQMRAMAANGHTETDLALGFGMPVERVREILAGSAA